MNVKCLIIFVFLLFDCSISNGQKVSASKNLERAIELINKNLEDEALYHLNECLIKQADNREALFLRARILNNKMLYLEALTDYNKLISIDPLHKEALYNRGIAKYHLNQFKPAMEDFYLCMKLPKSGTSTAYFKIDPTRNLATGIATMSNMEIDLWNYIGLCHFRLKEYQDAIEAYNQGLKIEKDNTDLLVNRALAYEKTGNYDQAKSDYQSVIQNAPNHETAMLNLIRLQSSEDKIIELDRFINNNPEHPVGYEDRGMVYFELQNYAAAERDFQKAMDRQPANPDYAFNLALTKIRLEKLTDAEKILSDLIEKDPQNAGAYFNLGNIKFQQTRFDEAVTYYTLAIAQDSGNAAYFYNRALAYHEINQLNKACADIGKAQAIDQKIGMEFKKKYCDLKE